MTEGAQARQLLVVTDLDGTLLDEDTYACDAACDALEALGRDAIPLVLATSKTQFEVAELIPRLPASPSLEITAIVENGGAIIVPTRLLTRPPAGAHRTGDDFVVELGLPRAEVVRHLRAIAEEAGVMVTGFSSLTPADVATLTGLSMSEARRAQRRQYDEPFLVSDQASVPSVVDAARRRGLEVTRGGRFFHLAAGSDKGRALEVLLAAFGAEGRRFTTVGLGDAANDLAMLRAVDRPVIVPRPGGAPDPVLAAALPGAERAPVPGPAGWNRAVLAVLAGRELPRTTGSCA